MFINDEHSLNKPFLIEVTFTEIVIFFNDEHLIKALLPIEAAKEGITIFIKDEHFWNKPFFIEEIKRNNHNYIELTGSGIKTCIRYMHNIDVFSQFFFFFCSNSWLRSENELIRIKKKLEIILLNDFHINPIYFICFVMLLKFNEKSFIINSCDYEKIKKYDHFLFKKLF